MSTPGAAHTRRSLFGGFIGLVGTRWFAGRGTAAQTRKRRVIISTDLATGLIGGWRAGVSDIDDGLSVLMALDDPDLEIAGVVVTFGNSQTGPELAASRHLLHDLAGHSVPILEGAHTRLANPEATLLGDPLPLLINEGVQWMADELDRTKCTVLCLGPLTDVATLISAMPAAASRIDEIIAIGGRAPGQSFDINGRSGLSDFNVALDPRAAEIVANSGIPTTFLGFTLTSSVIVPRTALDPFRGDPAPLTTFVVRAVDAWVDQWQQIFGEDGFHPWDQFAVRYASQPDAFRCTPVTPSLVPCSKNPEDPNACRGASLNTETAHLILDAAPGGGVVQQCTDFSSPSARQAFSDAVLAFLNIDPAAIRRSSAG